MENLNQKVKAANRRFYDTVGIQYEALDGRRSQPLVDYVGQQLKQCICGQTGQTLLDLGCGSGFVSRVGASVFCRRVGLDLSFNVLAAIEDDGLLKVLGDCDHLPFQNESMDCVATFAVLHHCLGYEQMMAHIYRVLKNGGVYYSDHDMDNLFYARFKPLLKLYRHLGSAWNRYRSAFSQLREDDYAFAEIHQDGIPSCQIARLLKQLGFKQVVVDYHWFGLSGWSDRLFGRKCFRQGFAPLVRIVAVK